MKETFSTTTTQEAPDREAAATPETAPAEMRGEAIDVQRLNELMDRLSRLLDEQESSKTPETSETDASDTSEAEPTTETTADEPDSKPAAETDAAPEEGETPSETTEAESPVVQRLEESRQRLVDLLSERESSTPEDEAEKEEDAETTPEAKERRGKKFLGKIGGWVVESLEANGFIPLRGKWHKRDGVTGFIAKSYVYSKQRKAARLAGFLSPEANAQLAGNEGETSPESDDDTHEDEGRLKKARRKLGRGAVRLARSPRTAYRTFKAIKNVK